MSVAALLFALGPWLDRFFAPYAGRGSIAIAVVQDGRVTVRAYGAAPDAVFRMASLSKVVTALAAVQLAQQRKLDLHAPVAGTLVTVHHLLTHTSGIEDAFFGNTVRVARRITLSEHFASRPPRFGRPAGRQIIYSNEGMTLAGRVIEQASLLPFEQFVQRNVFGPLGMTRSTFAQPPPFEVVPSGAEGEALVQAPAGAMVSTAADMARLIEALLRDDDVTRVLRAEHFPGVAYGLFTNDIAGYPALFHTGRSGHESVLYLVPGQRFGLFLVHTGGLDRDLRKRFVTEALKTLLPPAPRRVVRAPRLRSGIYRPPMFPVHRVERAAELGADASLHVDGDTAVLRVPPFASGKMLTFTRGLTADGYAIAGDEERFTVTGPLFEPVTFVRIPWYASGRVHLGAAVLGALILISAAIRRRGLALVVVVLLIAAPVAFLTMYMHHTAEERPFHVEDSLRVALTFLVLASVAALAMPFVAWRSRSVHDAIAAACAVAMPLFLWWWNLLGWRL